MRGSELRKMHKQITNFEAYNITFKNYYETTHVHTNYIATSQCPTAPSVFTCLNPLERRVKNLLMKEQTLNFY